MNETLQALCVIVIFLAVYFIPVWISTSNHHPHFAGISLLNLFLGWTLIGWVGALVWSVTLPRRTGEALNGERT